MPDHARSSAPAVQVQLDRLWALSPGADILGLGRVTALLARLGDPHHRLPPVFHVAGTNGKGSTCAFLRAGLEAAGYRVHAYTSPHLVRFNERIRLAGTLIDDDALAALLSEVLDAAGEGADAIGASFFEVTTAAAFLAFSRISADACVIEVGLGGRLDATNVLPAPVACGIAQLGIDHEAFLGSDPVGIAREKAGIAKPGCPLLTLDYPAPIGAAIAAVASAATAPVLARGSAWSVAPTDTGFRYSDDRGTIASPPPALAGEHQIVNGGLAMAMLRHQRALTVPDAALATMASAVHWPARLQRLGDGPLTRRAPAGATVWLDGGHNPAAAQAIAAALDRVAGPGHSVTVILGMLSNKDATGLLGPLADRIDALVAVPVPDHDHHAPADLAAIGRRLGIAACATAADVAAALANLPAASTVLILGSLYLAGAVLAANDELPD